MEFTDSGGEILLNHALVDYVLERCCLSDCGWLCFERRHVDRAVLLRLLPILASVSRVTRASVGRSVQLAALRLALFDVQVGAANAGRKMSSVQL